MPTAAQIARVTPPYGTLFALARNRDVTTGIGKLLPEDVTIITDRRAVAQQWELVAGFPVNHGTVTDEASMLALHTFGSSALDQPEPRYIAAGDSCLRSDDLGWRWFCVRGHGLALADWERRPLSGALEGFAAAVHEHAITDVSGLPEALAAKQSTLTISAVGSALLGVGTPETEKNIRVNPNGTISLLDPGTGASGLEVSSGPESITTVNVPYVSGPSEYGVLHYLGSLGGGTWSNPCLTYEVIVVATYGAAENFVDRANNTIYGYGVGSFVGVDVGAARSVLPNAYTLRNYTSPDRFIRSWVFEGTNAVAGNTVAQWNAATWDALDVRPYDETMVSIAPTSYTCTQPAVGYRYFRWRLTGNDSYGAPYMCVSEFEVYGTLHGSFGVVLPGWATGWLTDGTHYIPGVW